jgi:UDPglucose 6-dehydrogenase
MTAPKKTTSDDRPAPVISVIGTGYLGATHAAAMAEMGFETIGVDVDPSKLAALSAGEVPFYEPGLPELITKHVASGKLRFTADLAAAVAEADVHFVCVGTPQKAGSHAANLTYVENATRGVAENLTHPGLIVGKSTVPVGTAERLRGIVREFTPSGIDAELIWNPEFLREGKAVDDTLHPDRLVWGGASPAADAVIREVYAAPIAEGTPVITTDLATAELVKVSANAFLATKISFINAISEMCAITGADVSTLADALGHDARIGRKFLNAGLGFGGGCLPKDIRALMYRANEIGANRVVGLMQQVDEINMGQRERVIDMTIEALGGSVLNRRVAVVGAAFKPLTDDVRDSPALNVAAALHLRGAQVTLWDPEAMETARRSFPTLTYSPSMEGAIEDADVVLVLTEWDEIVEASPAALAAIVGRRFVIDARNCLPVTDWVKAGWTVRSLGRPTPVTGAPVSVAAGTYDAVATAR